MRAYNGSWNCKNGKSRSYRNVSSMPSSKGRRIEQKACDLYREAGFDVYLPPKAKYREQDVFGLFDLLAFGHDRLEGVQVKTNQTRGIRAWFNDARVYEEHLRDFRIGFLVWHDNEGWRFARSTPEKYRWVFDGREIGLTPAPELIEVIADG